ncbi:MAG: amino acid adenylation domain-containing protein, partial [Flammeovirgaceae bacterium]
EGNLPLSYAQQHVWFIDTLQGSTDYHMPSVYKLFGKLDVDAFEKAVQQLMDRHLILKTVYREQDGKPFQKVLTNYQWKLGYYSLVELGGNEELPAFIQQTINKPFNLSDESPLRIELVHCNEDEHLLILVLHHIACDGSSIPIFMKEIEQIYQAIIGNHPTALAELPIQYADYAIWQKDEVNEQQLTEQLNYWHQQLTNTEDLALHTDYPRTNQPTNEGAELSFVLPKTVSEQLERLALQEDATLFMVLLSAINILLHKYTGQHHFSVGTPIANRTKDELANLIGFFANTLALQSDLDSKLSYHDYLQQLKQHVLDAYSNQQVPFEKIVNQEVKKRDMSKNPIFQVMLTLNNQFSTASTAATWLGCQMETVDFEIETSQFDLSFDVVRVPDGFVFSINYRTDLFKEARIKQMQNHLVQLFESILQDTDQTIAQLRILTAEEELVLDNFSQAPTSTELAHATIIDFVEEQVAQSPQRQAIVLEDAAMTYEELATRSNQLAHYLTSQGVGKQARVAICLSPSADTIVAILGIMKAGAAYIPIDVNYPQQRIQFILADTAANAFIGNTDSIQLVANTPALLVVDIAKAQDRIRQQPSTSIINCVATDPAYIIYTSGSTGKPKGVLVEHQSLAMRIHTEAELLDASASTVTCLLTKYVFDVSLLEIFIPLLSGGKMVIPTDHMIYQPDLLLDLLAKHAVTLLQGTPSFFTPLVYAIEPEQSQQLQLKTLCIGGESLTTSLVEMIQEKLPQVQINNHYGPTEITIDATYLPNVTSFECNSIGKPLPNNTIYILDSALQKVPIGVPGDLYVGGSGLAREYINLPALTQEKFIAHPFQSSERLYKTGDVACWLPNGEIEFLGRKDNQVKVRGYRIELGEIEHALMSLDEIVQAVVVVKADQKGHKRLIAYIIPTDNYKQQQVQQQLQSQLPEYMIPRVMMELESFPTNFSGKVAVDQLPDPVMSELIDSKHVAPRSTVEKQLATIWQELLGLEAVGIHDNFFELGGDSIITIQVVSRAKRFSLQLKPRDLFEAQTIEKLAGVVEKRSKLIVGEQGLLTGDVPLMPIQQQWFAEGEYPEMSHFNQDMLLSLDKALLEAHLAEAVRALTTHHDALRFKYTKHENGWQQTYGSHEGQVSVVNLQDVQADQLPQEIEATCTQYQQSLSIEHGELVRWVLIQTPESEAYNRLFICIHHLAVDGVSWRILLDDLERSLKAVSTNQPIELGAKGSSYRAFVEALTNYATQDRIVDEQAYWKEMGKNTLPLPVDKEEQQPTLQEVERYMISLSAEHTEALLREVHQAYGTEINDLLLAALAKTLSEWAKYEKVLIGLEGHGREDIDSNLDISQTVGWFTNLYPIALSAPKNKQLDHWIKSVKEALRGIPSKGLGYSALRFLHPDKAIQPELAAIQPELIFNYLGQLDHIINEDAFFKGAAESRGESSSHASPFIPKLELNSSIGGGQLHMSWAYANTQYHAATIEQLATNYLNNLKTLIAHCQTVEQQQHTPSDFGLQGKVDFQELDSFLDTLENGQPRRALLQDIYSLSPMQEGMLFHGLYNTSSTAYTEQLSFDLHEVDVELLKKSWEYITEHHTVCRTRFFHNALSSPIQCVYRKVEVPFECFDYSNEQADHLSEKIDAFMQADIERGFTFDEVPLMRISLIKQTEKLHTMVWTSHHMLMDGWSLPIIIKDLLTAYEHFSQKQLAPAIPEDQYGKYIHFLAGLDGYAEQRFWKSYLAPLEQPTLLPFIGSTKERNKGGGEMDEMDLVLNPDVTEKIRQYAQENRITVNTVMQGVWAMLLAKYTGNESIAFGVTVSGRPPELEGAEQGVGLYINTIPICAQMDASMPMITWLQELQKGHTDAREFQYTALNKIHKWSGLHGDIFDNTLAFENFPIEKELANQWALKMGNVRSYERNNYLLSLTVKLGLQLVVNFRFNKSLLPTAYIEQVRSHFDTVLHQIITEKSIKQGAVNMVSTLEQQTLQEEFNNTAFAYPKQTNLVAQFEQQAAKSPDATALYFQNEAVSYHEFHRKVNQFAHYLKKQGVKKGDKVGICLERSVEMLVSIFGVLKVGAVYVPIDPQYPDTRVDFMLADAGIQVVITNAVYNRTFMFFEPLFEEREGIHSIIWEEAQDEIDAESDECASEEILLSDPAYVMYTSGTTGTPKGILVTHQNIFKLVMEPNDIAVQADDRVLQWSNFVFDGSTYDIYSALLKGAALHLISKEEARDVTQLARIIQEQQITVCFMTTALFNGFVNYDVEAFKGMRKLLFGGQLVSIPHVKKALEKLGPNVLVHVYGPTETTVYATYYPINHIENNLVPIGKPLANTSVYILSPQNQLAGIGVVGEICIGGDGVALGYLNRAELSKEKFVPDPFSSRENAKMYRTGDLARWLPNGCIDFVGRTDDQVKVRGYRIELGEVETVLQQAPELKECLVVAIDDGQNNKKLIAYVVGSQQYDADQVQEFLKVKLPAYMIPAMIIELAAFPLTPNGKIDKKALPEPTLTQSQEDDTYEAPRNETESLLVHSWEQTLKLERIGIHDNFFSVGGDSILAIRIISAVKKHFQVEISISDFYQSPSIAQLAELIALKQNSNNELEDLRNEVIEHMDQVKAATLAVIPNPETIEDVFPMSDIQKGMIFASEMNPDLPIYHDQMMYLLPFIEPERYEKALNLLVEKHAIFRTTFNLTDYSEEVQIVHRHEPVTIDYQDIRELSRAEQQAFLQNYVAEARKHPFDVKNGPLWKTSVFRVDDNYMAYLFQFHHAILDGWSFASLNTEWMNLCLSLQENPDIVPEKLSISYKDGVIDSLVEKSNPVSLDFWKKEMEDYTRFDIFESDDIYQDERVVYGIQFFERIKAVAQQLDVAPKTVCFGAYLFAMNMFQYEGDLTTGVVSNLRPLHEDGDKVLGCFLNTVPFRLDMHAQQSSNSWAVYLKELEQKLRNLKGLDRLTLLEIARITGENSSDGNPFFDVLFNYVDFHVYSNIQSSEEAETVPSHEEEAQESEETLEMVSHESTNTYLDISVSTTGGMMMIYYTLRKKLKHGFELKDIVHYFDTFLHAIVDDPYSAIALDASLPAKDRLLNEFNATTVEYPNQGSIVARIREQAAQRPNEIAIVDGATTFSYQELDQRSEQLAYYLQANGGQNTQIAVCLERSADMLIALLGILKAGAAYVPIDINYPSDRIRYMVEETAASFIITKQALSHLVPQHANLLCIDTDWAKIADSPASSLAPIDLASNAYIIFTSGSTGRPKGVMVSHEALMNLVNWHNDAYQVDATSKATL